MRYQNDGLPDLTGFKCQQLSATYAISAVEKHDSAIRWSAPVAPIADYEDPLLETLREAEEEELERQATELRRIFVSDTEIYGDEIFETELDYYDPILQKRREAEQEELERQETELRRIFMSDAEFYAGEIADILSGEKEIDDE